MFKENNRYLIKETPINKKIRLVIKNNNSNIKNFIGKSWIIKYYYFQYSIKIQQFLSKGNMLHRIMRFQNMTIFQKVVNYFSIDNYGKTFDEDHVIRHHGIFKVDEYIKFDQNQRQISQFISKQKLLFDMQKKKWEHLTKKYYKLASSRKDTRSTSISQSYDNYFYHTKTSWYNNRQYTTIYRKKNEQNSPQQLVLDIMSYSSIKRYAKTTQLVKTSFSQNHRYVAFGVDLRNDERISWMIADTDGPRNQLVTIRDEKGVGSALYDVDDIIFRSDNEIFYTVVQNHRPCKLIYHNIQNGTKKELFFEKDPQCYLSIKLSKDKKHLLLHSSSKQTTELYNLSMSQSTPNLIKIIERQLNNKSYVNHIDNFYVVFSQNQTNDIFFIMDEDVQKTSQKDSKFNIRNIKKQCIYSCDEQEYFQDIDIVEDSIILYLQKINKPCLKIINFKQKTAIKKFEAILPYNFGVVSPGTNQNYHTHQITYFISTPFVYQQAYSCNVITGESKLLQKYEHSGKQLKIQKYKIQHLNAPSKTGDYIPMTVIGPKNKKIGKLLLNFYGFYGLPTLVGYDNVHTAALEKGWTIAFAHIRGGGEKGKKWHQQALKQNRPQTWQDIQECTTLLIKEGYTHPSLLFLASHSAGAIALWNAINKKPHLYKGAIMKYPFVDVLNSLMDPNQPLSNTDYEQFGNPTQNIETYQQIQSFCPYQNIEVKEYPAVHIVAGQNDYRTPVNQIAKFVSRYRDKVIQNNRFKPIGIKGLTVDISSTASHQGQSNIQDENYKACDVFGYMDYVIDEISNDCKIQ